MAQLGRSAEEMNTPPPLPTRRARPGAFLLHYCVPALIIAALFVVRHPAISEYVRPPAPFAVLFCITFLIGPSVLAFVTLGESLIARMNCAGAKVLALSAGLVTASALFLYPVDEYRFGRDLGFMPMLTVTTLSVMIIVIGRFIIRKKNEN